MEQEFTITTGWKIFYGVIAALLFLFSLFLFSMPKNPSVSATVELIPLSIFAVSILIIVNIIKRKVVIHSDSILCVNLFSRKEIAIADIKGCRVGEKVIIVEPLSADQPRISISNYDDLTDSEDLKKYFKENFKNVNAIDLENERSKILQNTELGATEKDREATVSKARQIGWVYNILGMILGFSLILVNDSELAVLALICYPLIGILIMIFSKGLIKFVSNSKTSVYGFTMLGFFMPVFVSLIKSMFEYTLLEYSHIWVPFLIISTILFTLLFFLGINKAVTPVKVQPIIMLIVSLMYGYGSTRQINCTFDQSTPKSIQTTVSGKWIEHNKGTFFHLKLTSWNGDPQPKDIEVSRSVFNAYEEGSSITVYVKPGVLHIPWYYVTQ